ncbi:MAG TPA: hypothetical protein ENK22_03340 [Persephonella sp.]|nr:hypothetical protein [Persephonella sp.]
MRFLVFIGLFCLSYAQDRVIIEKKGQNHYHVETYTEPSYKPKREKYKKSHRYRKKSRFYVASKKGKVFHRPSCRFSKKIKNKIIFKTKRKAKNSGLRPCKLCRP